VVQLPVSGLEPALPLPSGVNDLILCETSGPAVSRLLAYLSTLSGDRDWAALTVTDFEILLLRLRERLLGDNCDLAFACPACGARVEVSFRIADFLEGLQSKLPANVKPAPDRPGWFECEGAAFRLPTAGDQATVAGCPDAVERLVERCIEPADVPARLRDRIERAMALMAPEVSRPLVGSCPECGDVVEAPLHVSRLVASELTREAAALYDEVDLIARTYHWPEADILELPRQRRRAYVDRIRRAA
jgi:predicted RNA-binding Zn-ribbon protein involved in translation (DUF1610 family)